MSTLWLQVALYAGWGGHTSYNDLVAAGERWHRFYSMGEVGVRLFAEKRLQPAISVELGRFISQDRRQGLFSQTQWSCVGVSLRLRPFKKALSPLGELHFFRLSASIRGLEGRTLPGAPASISTNGVGWNAGLSWRMTPFSELSLLYLRRRPQTSFLEGVGGPTKDRIEGLLGQISLYLFAGTPNRSRF